MSSVAKFIGLDVHKATISIAVCDGTPGSEVRDLGRIPHDVPRLLRRLERLAPVERLHVAYEAGPTGYGLCRALRERGIACQVVAPSRTPIRSGDRVKTDRRDAEKLARFLRSGELVAVDLPDVQREALRDLVRARSDAMRARHCARQQLSSFLLHHGRHWEGSAWTRRYVTWIRSQRFDIEERQVMEDYLNEVAHADQRLEQLTDKVKDAMEKQASAPLARALSAMRGVSTIVTATLVAELGDLRRFKSASRLMSYVGLTPSEHSSGASVHRGAITKAGNPHVRRVLIEAAWCAQQRPAMGATVKRRNEGVPLPIQDIAWKAQNRLHKRYWRLRRRGKSTQTAIVAIARAHRLRVGHRPTSRRLEKEEQVLVRTTGDSGQRRRKFSISVVEHGRLACPHARSQNETDLSSIA